MKIHRRKTPPPLPSLTDEQTPKKTTTAEKQKHQAITEEVERFAAAGLTLRQMSIVLGITEQEMARLRLRPSIRNAVNAGKKRANEHVKASLYARAIGGLVIEEVYERQAIGGGRGEPKVYDTTSEPILVKVTRKTLAPDVVAQMYWLNNRDGENWKSKNEVTASTVQRFELADLATMTPDQLQEMRRRMLERKAELSKG